MSDCISRQAVIDLTWEEPSYTDALNVLTEIRDKIKALPSVTPTQNRVENTLRALDCISRQEAIAEIYDKYMSSDMAVHNDVANECMRIIKALPSVTPTERTGHWIYTGDYLTEGMLKCSECGEEIDVSESYYDFCPVCGCRMVEPQESEDKE